MLLSSPLPSDSCKHLLRISFIVSSYSCSLRLWTIVPPWKLNWKCCGEGANSQHAQRLSGVWFLNSARAATAFMLRPGDNASAGRGAFPASLGGRVVAGGMCKARCCVIALRFRLSVLLSKRQTRLQVINCISCNSSLFRLLAHAATHGSETKMCEARQGALSPVQISSPL